MEYGIYLLRSTWLHGRTVGEQYLQHTTHTETVTKTKTTAATFLHRPWSLDRSTENTQSTLAKAPVVDHGSAPRTQEQNKTRTHDIYISLNHLNIIIIIHRTISSVNLLPLRRRALHHIMAELTYATIPTALLALIPPARHRLGICTMFFAPRRDSTSDKTFRSCRCRFRPRFSSVGYVLVTGPDENMCKRAVLSGKAGSSLIVLGKY
jgi:hypothetical protein